jgi:hypothetical protein
MQDKPKPTPPSGKDGLKFAYGKYKDTLVSEVPSDYLLYFRYENKKFLKEYDRVLRERGDLPLTTLSRIGELVTAGQQALAKKYHPECGGTQQEMNEVDAAADAIFEIMEFAKK